MANKIRRIIAFQIEIVGENILSIFFGGQAFEKVDCCSIRIMNPPSTSAYDLFKEDIVCQFKNLQSSTLIQQNFTCR
ncbi:hypothetical protein Tanf_06135 [Tannerella forsythia]|nr:hypothetical protein Tanf_06135 [Tannerella forsythia]